MVLSDTSEGQVLTRPDPPGAPLFHVSGMSLRATWPSPAILVDDVSFDLARGECVALIGESGCGKSLTCWSSIGLPPANVAMTAKAITFAGTPLMRRDAPDMANLRGKRIAMIFQDPVAALNPTRRIGHFLVSLLRKNRGLDRRAAQAEAVGLLQSVGIARAAERMSAYPHELSGGQCQRVMIAGALTGAPDVLIADEPTTALDVTTQAQIMELLSDLRRTRGLAVLLVTHDLGVVAEYADRAMVMYAGRIVEEGPVQALLSKPRHPYAQGLLRSLPPEHGKAPLTPISGTVPDLANRPDGCAFAPRCSRALTPTCTREKPVLEGVACWNPIPCPGA